MSEKTDSADSIAKVHARRIVSQLGRKPIESVVRRMVEESSPDPIVREKVLRYVLDLKTIEPDFSFKVAVSVAVRNAAYEALRNYVDESLEAADVSRLVRMVPLADYERTVVEQQMMHYWAALKKFAV